MNVPHPRTSGAYRLADLTLDTGQRRVRRGKANIELPKLTFDLLEALVRAAPDSLSTDQLIDQVWDGAVVNSATVAKRVELLRQALDDDSNEPRYIALVRGYGYRLIPRVQDATLPIRPPYVSPVIGGILAIVAVVFAWYLLRPGDLPPEKSVAVLPFVSMSTNADDEIFADGLTEELSHVLTRTTELRVTGRTSSFHYKGHNEDLRVIGKALGVAYLLEGSVRRSGDKLRVTAQLVSADDGFHLWSETYDRQMSDIFEIQNDIARSVTVKLRASLVNVDVKTGGLQESITPDGYALYLQAVSRAPYGIGHGLGEAQRLIEEVTKLAPGFAPGWNLLAAIHGRRQFFRDPSYQHSPQETMRIMHDAVEKALDIDPDSGEAYANLAGVAWVFDGDAIKAAPLVERALELDPRNLDIVSFAADFAKYIGHLDEALELEELLIDWDPLCDPCRLKLAKSYMFANQFEAAEQQLLTLQSMGGGLRWTYGIVLLMKQQPQEALESFRLLEDDAEDLEYLRIVGRVMALHDLGRHEESAAALAELEQRWGAEYPQKMAQAFAYVGQLDKAFQWLELSLQTGTIKLQTDFPEPVFNAFRDDPRWRVVMERIGRSPAQMEKIPFSLDTVRTRLLK